MIKVGLREANINFSKYLKMVRAGEDILLTERGEPLAVIKLLRRKGLKEDERIRLLEELGILKRAEKIKVPLHRLVTLKGKSLSEIVAEGREERLSD